MVHCFSLQTHKVSTARRCNKPNRYFKAVPIEHGDAEQVHLANVHVVENFTKIFARQRAVG